MLRCVEFRGRRVSEGVPTRGGGEGRGARRRLAWGRLICSLMYLYVYCKGTEPRFKPYGAFAPTRVCRKKCILLFQKIQLNWTECPLIDKHVSKQALNWRINSLHISEIERPSSCSCLTVPYVYLGLLLVDLQVVSRWQGQLSAIIIARKPYSRESEKWTFVPLGFRWEGSAMFWCSTMYFIIV